MDGKQSKRNDQKSGKVPSSLRAGRYTKIGTTHHLMNVTPHAFTCNSVNVVQFAP